MASSSDEALDVDKAAISNSGTTKPDKESEHFGREASSCTISFLGNDLPQDLNTWAHFRIPLIGYRLRFNPVITVSSVAIIWSFVAWCVIAGEDVPFNHSKAWISQHFTWLYVGSMNIWMVFLAVLYHKFGHIKFGGPEDAPEYTHVTWFVMLFSCGLGIGLFFFSIGEPILHYTGRNRYSADPTLPDNTLAQISLDLIFFHYGFHAWIVYSLVGLVFGITCHREQLPVTMKSCFLPLIGDRVYGWMGDLIDSVSIVSTLFGVCVTLGIGARQVNSGLSLLFGEYVSMSVTTQIVIIWIITVIATVSTVTGVKMGIRRLSEVSFGSGMFIMLTCLFMDNTAYLLDLLVQSFGFFWQTFVQLMWHTDVFERLGPAYGSQDRGRFIPEGFQSPEGPEEWYGEWTLFTWGWWIAWAPFVGMFIAKISKGRTIGEFIRCVFFAPVLYVFLWMTMFGGIGIEREREAAGKGLCCGSNHKENSGFFFKSPETIWRLAGERGVDPAQTVLGPNFEPDWICIGESCNSCAHQTIVKRFANTSLKSLLDEYDKMGEDFGRALPDRSQVRLSCFPMEQMWFETMATFPVIGNLLAVFSLFAIVLLFVTSADSGSLVIDCMAANGDPDPPKLQRIFWSVSEGALASALIAAGGSKGLMAFQAAALISGLPVCIFLWCLCFACWRLLKIAEMEETGDITGIAMRSESFACGLFDCFYTDPITKINWKGSSRLFGTFVKNLFLGPFTVARVSARVEEIHHRALTPSSDADTAECRADNSGDQLKGRRSWWPTAFALACFFYGSIACQIIGIFYSAFPTLGLVMYIGYTVYVASVRYQVRERRSIRSGSLLEDVIVAMIFSPNVAMQMEVTILKKP